MDVDGSAADPGACGGPDGNGWDRDLDGLPDYFWPGTLEDAPPVFSPDAYDGDDLSPS